MKKRASARPASARSRRRTQRGKQCDIGADHPGDPTAASAGQIRIPVIKEQLKISKRSRPTGRVAVQVIPEVRAEGVDVRLAREEVQVERVPVNRVVDEPFGQYQEGDTTIIPVFEEVLVVEKRLMLKEEVRITRRRKTRDEHRDVRLRAERVRITRNNT